MNYTYKGFTISLELKVTNIYDIEITEEVNQHLKLTIQGLCQEERLNQYISQVDEKKEIVMKDSDNHLFFCGLITNLQLEEKQQVCYFHLESTSYTYQMDLVKRKRVFQNLDFTYQEVLNTIISKYPNASFIDKISNNKKIPHILIQYNETDWEFLKRLASHFHDGIYTNSTTDTIQISFGRLFHEKVHEIDRQPDNIKCKLLKKQEINDLETYEKYEIGDTVINQGRACFVYQVRLFTKKEEIRYQIQMLYSKEETFPYISNKYIANAREWAYITYIKRNQLKLHFLIEDITGENIPLFPFEAGQNNELGYYMSEKGNKVEVYFPDEEEKNGIVTCVMREGASPVPNPPTNIHSLKNENGNELKMDLQGVILKTGGGQTVINMTGDGMLRLETDESLKLSSSGNINLGGGLKRLQIRSGRGIQLKAGNTGNNSIELDESGNVECRCSGNVLFKKKGNGSSRSCTRTGESGGADQVRDVTLALAGVEFVSQSITGKTDYSSAGKMMNQLVKSNSSLVEKKNHQENQNPIKTGLFNDNEALFNSFSYGENRNGNKR